MGGINGDLQLANASSLEMDQVVRDTLEVMAPGGGFILHVVPGVYAGVPWNNVLGLVEVWKRYA